MSVILQALKKLEKESTTLSSAAWSGDGSRQIRQGWRKMAFPFLVGIVLSVVAAAGTMRYVRNPLFQETVDIGVGSKEASLPARTTPAQTPLSNRASEPVFSGPDPEFSDVFQKKSVNNLPFEAEIDGEASPSPEPVTVARIPAPIMPKAAPRVTVMEDPALSLQAISWSADPEKRLAIINGKICREKEHVGGYVIEAINAGDVVLSKGGESGKLVFKIR